LLQAKYEPPLIGYQTLRDVRSGARKDSDSNILLKSLQIIPTSKNNERLNESPDRYRINFLLNQHVTSCECIFTAAIAALKKRHLKFLFKPLHVAPAQH